ncbi:hypothetical protein QTP88_005124 [Uroleucon formosanum]
MCIYAERKHRIRKKRYYLCGDANMKTTTRIIHYNACKTFDFFYNLMIVAYTVYSVAYKRANTTFWNFVKSSTDNL